MRGEYTLQVQSNNTSSRNGTVTGTESQPSDQTRTFNPTGEYNPSTPTGYNPFNQ